MSSASRSPLFENALDSLDHGIRLYLNDTIPNHQKHAIRAVFHSVELFLKERLYEAHPLLIWRHVSKPVSDKAQTVGFDECVPRLANVGVALDKSDLDSIEQLRRRRNRIEHYHYEPDAADGDVLGEVLKFLDAFVPRVLGASLEDLLDPEIYRTIRTVIYTFEERLSEAEAQVEAETAIVHKHDLPDARDAIACPECGKWTLVPGTDRGNYCFLCRNEFDLLTCELCGTPTPIDSGEISRDFRICDNCASDYMSKND